MSSNCIDKSESYWPVHEISVLITYAQNHGRIQRGGRGPTCPPGKSQVAIGFLRNSGKDPFQKQLDPLGSIVSQRRSVWLSVKYGDDITKTKRCQGTPGLEFIKFEYSLRLKIKCNDWLPADTCPQAANHCALFLV